eukprot:TRINITY_DN37045_c0_g1_i1.p1 TRINITY_DN37045_c0_g1~~TRINITY_DN37045_c0_g1_i1.p1  ORF type:complete len:161 (+),score=51.22 TRINITY_DN37045_c0_g1_i1:57-485(+)
MATTTAEERAAAAAMRSGDGCGAAELPSGVPALDIKPGRQKYVLIALPSDSGRVSYLVRGDPRASYHKDAAEPTLRQLRDMGLRHEVLGGGRIEYDADAGRVAVFGFSYGFPWQGEPRHDVTAAVISSAMPGAAVTVSNDGY